MTSREFDRCRLANQHIADQAAPHGVIMAGGKLELGHNRGRPLLGPLAGNQAMYPARRGVLENLRRDGRQR